MRGGLLEEVCYLFFSLQSQVSLPLKCLEDSVPLQTCLEFSNLTGGIAVNNLDLSKSKRFCACMFLNRIEGCVIFQYGFTVLLSYGHS